MSKQVTEYGKIAIGQRIEYSRIAIAPTNSVIPCCCMRDPFTLKIIHPDETIGFSVIGTVTNMFETTSGCTTTIRLDSSGEFQPHINLHGRQVGGFAIVRALREAPRQLELTA
jgi:hypothetical protein